jgi:YesN/AraC family two-component response regulator
MNVLNRINEVIQKIRYILSNYLNINITVGLSHVLNGYGNIPKLYNIAQGNARLRYLIGKGKNISTSERDLLLSIKNIDKDMKSSKFKKLLQIKMEEKKLIDALHLIDKKLVVEELNNILELIDNFNEEKIEDIHIYYIELFLMIVEKTIGEKVEDYKNNYEHMDFLQTIISFETKEEVDRWIINQTNLLLEERLNKYVTSEVDIIRKVRKYIRRNYKNKIKLEMISQYVGLSEGYFSKIFTKNTGENFSTYLTKYRIDKAKELLKTTDKKIYEICDEIGYENVEHFSRTFKKIIGCSPKKYQSQNFVS